MIIVLKTDVSEAALEEICGRISRLGLDFSVTGTSPECIHIHGAGCIDQGLFEQNSNVERVIRISDPFAKAAVAAVLPEICGRRIGRDTFTVIAGPCAVENEMQLTETAAAVKETGCGFLRGGGFKPRTSPYAFQGLGREGLVLLQEIGRSLGMSVVSEITSPAMIDLFCEYVDIIQVGAAGSRSYELLKELGKTGKPVLLKNGPADTADDLLMSCEYILSQGGSRVILCLRGIRTIENAGRYTLDLTQIPYLKTKTCLPILADPSHSAGKREFVPSLALAAAAAGADGLLIEVHCNPEDALCDGAQSMNIPEFSALMKALKKYAALANRVM